MEITWLERGSWLYTPDSCATRLISKNLCGFQSHRKHGLYKDIVYWPICAVHRKLESILTPLIGLKIVLKYIGRKAWLYQVNL